MSVSSERVKAWRNRTKDKMVEAMGGKCQCCGYDTCKQALAFHHIDPSQKDFSFGKIRANPKEWSTIVEELKKCILVCHNCHSEIHYGVREVPKEFSEFNHNFSNIENVLEYDDCPMCGNTKPKKRKFCGYSCSAKNSRKVDWDSVDLLKLMETHSISELEKMFDVSNTAIYKRRNKILKSNNAGLV